MSSRRLRTFIVVTIMVIGASLVARSVIRLQHRIHDMHEAAQHRDVDRIAGWMTAPYLARAYHVPPRELSAALGVNLGNGITPQSTLNDIAERQKRDPEEVIAAARKAVLDFRAAHPPPPPRPGAPSTPGGGRVSGAYGPDARYVLAASNPLHLPAGVLPRAGHLL